MRFEGKVAVVSGAASGIGRKTAQLLAREGARVVAADMNTEGVALMIERLGPVAGEITPCRADVSSRAEVESMIDLAVDTYGGLDILVNNAGLSDYAVPIDELTDDWWRKIMGVNLDGMMYACRKGVQVMLARGGGAIVNVGSVSSLTGGRAGVAYTASKHAVLGITQNIAYFYAQRGIRCNAVCPGTIRTNILSGGHTPSEFGTSRTQSGIGANPRLGSAEETAKAILFLASDDAGYVNGVGLPVDGGWSAY